MQLYPQRPVQVVLQGAPTGTPTADVPVNQDFDRKKTKIALRRLDDFNVDRPPSVTAFVPSCRLVGYVPGDTLALKLVGKPKGSELRQSVHPHDERGDGTQRRH